MILIIDSVGQEYSLFEDLTLRHLRSGHATPAVPAKEISRCGILVSHIKGPGLIRADGPLPLLNDREKIAVMELGKKFKEIWLISDTDFFNNLPPEVLVFNPSGLKHGLVHASIFEEAVRALGHPASKTNLISCYLDNESSIAAIRGGVVVDLNTDLPNNSNFDQFTGFSVSLAEVVAKPKLRENPKFRLAFKSYIHQVRLTIGAFVSELDRIDGVALSGSVAWKYPGLVESIEKSLLGFKNVPFIRLEARPHRYAAELLRNL